MQSHAISTTAAGISADEFLRHLQKTLRDSPSNAGLQGSYSRVYQAIYTDESHHYGRCRALPHHMPLGCGRHELREFHVVFLYCRSTVQVGACFDGVNFQVRRSNHYARRIFEVLNCPGFWFDAIVLGVEQSILKDVRMG